MGWASRAWWRSEKLEHLCENEETDCMYGFTGATTRCGGPNAWSHPLQLQHVVQPTATPGGSFIWGTSCVPQPVWKPIILHQIPAKNRIEQAEVEIVKSFFGCDFDLSRFKSKICDLTPAHARVDLWPGKEFFARKSPWGQTSAWIAAEIRWHTAAWGYGHYVCRALIWLLWRAAGNLPPSAPAALPERCSDRSVM